MELSKITLQRGQEIEIKITDYAFGGRGIGKIQTENGLFVVFVDNTFPGQTVRVKIDAKRKNHAEAKGLSFDRTSCVNDNASIMRALAQRVVSAQS